MRERDEPASVAAASGILRTFADTVGRVKGEQGDDLTAEGLVFENAAMELYYQRKDHQVDAEHILMAAATDTQCRAHRLLRMAGLDPRELAETVRQRMDSEAYRQYQNGLRPNSRTERLDLPPNAELQRMAKESPRPLLASDRYFLSVVRGLAQESPPPYGFTRDAVQRLERAFVELERQRPVREEDPRIPAIEDFVRRSLRPETPQ
jgi:ATP-dependent Clp protease ATP-binding subunit ClpA